MYIEEPQTRTARLRAFLIECRRVLFVTKKPTTEELKVILKVSGLGILLLGFIGFLLQMTKHFLFG